MLPIISKTPVHWSFKHVLRLIACIIALAFIVGSLVSLFYFLLDGVTVLRQSNDWLLFALPFAGIGIHFLYKWAGKNASGGNTLIINEIHQPGGGVPARMAPL